MKKRKKNVIYCIAYMVLWVVFRIVMPTRCINKQNRPEGGALLCANHTRTNDPLFIAYALGWHYQIHVMAKEEIMHWPFIGWVLKHGGIFGVKRGKADVAAIKTAMKYLKDGELLLMFPEGTRHQDGEFGDAKTGAAIAREVFGMPQEAYDAIYWHTTGKGNMTLLEKILYVADYMEPNRDFEGVERLRELAYSDLDAAVLLGCEMSIQDMGERGQPVHFRTREAYDWLRNRKRD